MADFDTLDGRAPLVIGHRGASAQRPEHTIEAYTLAIEQGADVIEPDLVVTRDRHLIARHENEIGGTSDVADRPEFADRRTTKLIDGQPVTGWFAEDFTLAEIKTLFARERIPDIRPDNAAFNDLFRIPTLAEVVELVKHVEADTGRRIDIVPEIKHPTYFSDEGRHLDGTPIGVDTGRLLIETLVAQDFAVPERVTVQSFEPASLIALQTATMPAAGVDLPLVQLLGGSYDIAFNLDPANLASGADPGVYDALGLPLTVQSATNGDLYTPDALRAMQAVYAEAIGPFKDSIRPTERLAVPVDGDGDGTARITSRWTGVTTSLVADAHAAGLEVYPYTLRDEEAYQRLKPDGTVETPEEEYRAYIALGVDGFFTDSPGTGRAIVDAVVAEKGGTSPAAGGGETPTVGPVKNIIVMIGDGAGFNTLEATRLYLQALPPGDPRGGVGGPLVMDGPGWVYTAQSVYPLDTRTRPVAGQAGLEQNPVTYYNPALNYDLRPVQGNTAPVVGLAPDGYPRGFEGYDWNRRTYPDSANTATAMSSGEKTYNNALNVDGNGEPVVAAVELAKSLGKATGVVSTVQMSDATPAAFGGAHNESRTNRTDIAAEMFRSGVLDVIAGTGNPERDDDGHLRDTPLHEWIGADVWAALKDGSFRFDDGSAWRLLQDRADIAAAGTGEPGGERLAMIAEAYTSHQFNRSGATPATEAPFTVPRLESSPTLTELSRAALNRLGADEDGLFVTIEAGAVDRAMHANNFGRMIEEYIEFNDAVKAVVEWVDSPDSRASWDDTLLIVTADHDHLLFGPEGATIPYQPVQPDRDGDGVPEYAWFSNTHSNQIVPLYAYGAGAGQVRALADDLDLVFDERGRAIGGSGRAYTDQAELGDFLLEQLRAGATKAAPEWDMPTAREPGGSGAAGSGSPAASTGFLPDRGTAAPEIAVGLAPPG